MMTKVDIKTWFCNFLNSCPAAQLTIGDIIDQVAMVFPEETGEIIADLLFKEFDIDMNGLMDCTEFLVAIPCLATPKAAGQKRSSCWLTWGKTCFSKYY